MASGRGEPDIRTWEAGEIAEHERQVQALLRVAPPHDSEIMMAYG